ncbi:MAG: polymerase IV protein [Candidatus Amesbacteria bacterium GW2011_GWA1_47_16]|nr:MAG: polymerase IV protein [Candidatus Amesbacteria bacterium GW2011_GWA1_47_16]KKU98187.1 MAG: polymerase IV protein [Candidatus Amesbacteria bacterium GW2011_GWB1_48_13]OGC99509.1 MAG: hypothetical protein A2701_04295 [Candidatus Amesbacteria bacterium RIFCSPHIGHO2_01_FULL_47_34]OGD01966.1 MAG: hypothetical protein A2972_02530 [Candidatus Amesbacteria bacterium RIFCSPLOWO2_01_FULL_47_33]
MHKNMTNLEVAELLRAVAAALSLTIGDNRFRIIAYERAADAVEHSSSEIKDLWDDGKLSDLAGIGESIASHLDELFRTGKVAHFQKIIKPFPSSVFELIRIPGIGPKNALKLSKALKITQANTAVSQLEKAAAAGLIVHIEGFGEDSQSAIIKSIAEFRGRSRRMLLPVAQEIADSVIEWLSKSPHVKRADPLGSLRRQASTVGDVDISAASDNSAAVIEHFGRYPKKSRVLEAGQHTSSLILGNGYQVDLMIQPPDSYGSLLQHFTGSKHHNILLREFALKKGYSLSEYGIRKLSKSLTKFSDEESFYNFLGLQYIPPELREGHDEIRFAQSNSLPELVELDDIKGDFQIHSNIDVEPGHDLGESSLTQLAETAESLNYQYLGITEHNPSVSGHTQKQILNLIKHKTELVNVFNTSHENRGEKRVPYIFNGLEIDILPDGTRALPESALDLLDFACVSIHSSFRQGRKEITARVLRALDHPKIRFFAHPTARLLGSREGIDLEWDQIFDFCLKNNKWLEINGWPNRLDLPDTLVRDALKFGIKLIVDTDSHSHKHLKYMRYGVSVARRGWAKNYDIINTLSLTEIKKLIKTKK